ncbi:pyruvate dehydrogenase E2 component (dihydrolipoamide acetyltransferase) [Nannocystis exedens]|uniref:Dihydrolipoamide acetyltransferase component of pyruvate dehydrogenase complex n=1 Tax=Nannocystis exedens TaxID=54 RepID=A0A1I2BDS7_9BACT|nr:2-oxo acid dehydrogenase subunit E2 [Nannocystis exedens]PCC68030.1 dihydrolipoyllysine-residue acetyltransferase component of pyruvate dehydrogenase complex [Nannocystis exedens]SFE54321.1 pyruvate dehydrogenase E2 component (dihydrolipoamide acetyltransferase) [Nannocystis exedens]
MATVVTLPRLSDTMEEGVIAKWRIKVGDKVKRGQVIADIETDKATMEFESFDAGTVLKLVAPEGEALPVGAPIAVFGQPGENPDAAGAPAPKAEAEPAKAEDKPKAEAKPAPEAESKPAQPEALAEIEVAQTAAAESAVPDQAPAPKATSQGTGPEGQADRGRIPASPVARRLAREHDLELGQIQGSGPRGRIVKADVEQAIAKGPTARPAAAAATGPAEHVPATSPPAGTPAGEVDEHGRPYISRPDRTVKLSQMRKTIAKRMGQAKREIPHIYLTMPIVMDRAVALRAEFNLSVDGTKASLNDLVILAAARALRKHPRVNAYYTDNGIVERGDIHVGVAVALDEGLIVPPVRFADQKTLKQISIDVRDLGTRAKEKTLKPEEMTGSTFTVSNLGMFGIEEFCAIVNPGEAAILAVGAVQDEAVVEDGQIVARKRMRVTLCSDHRVFDGAESAKYLQTLRKLLESPLALLT